MITLCDNTTNLLCAQDTSQITRRIWLLWYVEVAFANFVIKLRVEIHDDRSSFRSELKATVKPLIKEHYDIFPQEGLSNKKRSEYIQKEVSKLLNGECNFLILRLSKSKKVCFYIPLSQSCDLDNWQGPKKPFGHPIIKSAITSFFYGGSNKLSSHFPEHFEEQPPLNAIALIATSVSTIAANLFLT